MARLALAPSLREFRARRFLMSPGAGFGLFRGSSRGRGAGKKMEKPAHSIFTALKVKLKVRLASVFTLEGKEWPARVTGGIYSPSSFSSAKSSA